MMGRGNARQDHDAEEAGLLRANPNNIEGIEMQSFQQHPIAAAASREDQHVNIYTASQPEEGDTHRDGHHLDSFYAGDHMLANLSIQDTIHTQWRITSATAGATSASEVQTAASIAGLTLAFSGRASSRGQA